MSQLTNSHLLYPLASTGAYSALNISIDAIEFQKDLESFKDQWRPYNERKNIPRFGLSLTSLDGRTDGFDLDSLLEIYENTGSAYSEDDFKALTPIAKNFPSLQPLLDPFKEFLGRSHILRLDRGGHFPPHRDDFRPNLPTYRILMLANHCNENEFYFMLKDQRIHLKPWVPYFVDTRLEHAVFSFVDGSVQVVLNVIISEDSVNKALGLLEVK